MIGRSILAELSDMGVAITEAAVTAALVRAPNAKAAAVAQRACGVLKVMQPTVKTDCVGLDL